MFGAFNSFGRMGGLPGSAASSPPPSGDTDPYFANVVLLLRPDGAGGFADYSGSAHAFTAQGSAGLTAAAGAFGGDAFHTDGASQMFTSPPSTDFEFPGDFSIEFYGAKPTGTGGGAGIILTTDTSNGSASNGWFVEVSADRGLVFATANGVVISYVFNPDDDVPRWYAITRDAGVLSAWVNGVAVATAAFGVAIGANGDIGIGGNSYNNSWTAPGDWDQIRITKGVARAVSVPVAPFPTA